MCMGAPMFIDPDPGWNARLAEANRREAVSRAFGYAYMRPESAVSFVAVEAARRTGNREYDDAVRQVRQRYGHVYNADRDQWEKPTSYPHHLMGKDIRTRLKELPFDELADHLMMCKLSLEEAERLGIPLP